MSERQIYIPPGGPPRVESPNPEIYARMGEEKIFAMLEDFYRELEHSTIRGIGGLLCRLAGRSTALSPTLWQPDDARPAYSLCNR